MPFRFHKPFRIGRERWKDERVIAMNAHTRHAGTVGLVLSAARMRKRGFCRPLAVLMVLFMLPAGSSAAGFSHGAPPPPPTVAAQQIGGCDADPTSPSIIRQYCVNGTPYVSDLTQLESDAVSMYLAENGLSASDAHVVYDYGRTDLRSAVRANMLILLQRIFQMPAAVRASQGHEHEQNLYNWFAALVQQNEIALYTQALNQFNTWQADPCRFTLDPTVAAANNLSYDGAVFCGSPLNALYGGPPVPAESYFTAYGMRMSYATPADTYRDFSTIVARTAIIQKQAVGILAASYALVAGGAVALGVHLAGILSVGSGLAADGVGILSFTTVDGLGAVALTLGPAAIVLIAVMIGVTAGVQTFTRQAILDDLNNLSAQLAQAKAAPPDLLAFLNDTSGLGSYKIQLTLVAQTMPEMPSTNALPQHAATDLNFAFGSSIPATVGDTLTYRDWDGNTWTAKTWGGWFVKTCAGATCAQTESVSGSIDYVDWSGVKWSASRLGNNLTSVKANTAPGDVVCPAGETGVSPQTDVTGCSSYVSASIPLKDGNGNLVSVSLSAWAPPVIDDIVSLPFNPGVASSRTISVAGNPTPYLCFSAGSLPANFTLNGNKPCGIGSFQITYDGTPQNQGSYPLTLVADNGIGSPVAKQFTVDFSPQLAITSSNTLVIDAGFPVHFTVTATGNPTPTLSLDPLINWSDLHLTFTDNGDGTATISGTPLTSLGLAVECFHEGGAPCGIIATNSQGTVEQQLNVQLVAAPSASLVPPTSAAFLTGVPNQALIRTTGAVTPVSLNIQPACGPSSVPPPGWLVLEDRGDGTAFLQGTPPLGTTGTFGLCINAVAAGSFESAEPRPFNYQLTVADQPAFTSPNTATFTTGVSGEFQITANEGTISLAGTLPQGLAFNPGSPVSITGTPAAGTSGDYMLTLVADAGALGTANQSLQVRVNAPPTITSDNRATFISGSPGMFAVTTTGFPVLSTLPVPASYAPPTDTSGGLGMFFTVTGLPSGLHASNLNAENFATGTLTIEGTPTVTGTYPVQITAVNGVGAPALQTLMLTVVGLTGPAPASGSTCNGNYNQTFTGTLTVTAGQNCNFIGGVVTGNVLVSGGSFSMTNATITGNLSIQGNAAFSVGEGSHVGGNLTIQNVSSAASNNRVCGARVGTNLSVNTNATAVAVGAADIVDCPGNVVGGNLSVQGNTGATTIYNNAISKNLVCSSNTLITGGGNVANKKQNQCSAF
jgi:hypothetical protein